MIMKPIPERGDELVLTCRGCSKSNLMKIKSIKKNAQNEDGSWCYTVKAVCNICGFMNGDYRPIWYNFSLYTTNFTEPLSYQDSAFLKLPKFP